MYRTLCVMGLVALCAGLAHSFSWEIAAGCHGELKFIDINGTLTHTEKLTSKLKIRHTTYDPIHNRLVFADYHKIYIFDIATNKTELISESKNLIHSLAYDPVTELVFWVIKSKDVYSISLKPEMNNSIVIEKHLILTEDEDRIRRIAVDSCGRFIYLMKDYTINRVQFNGTESEVVIDNDGAELHALTIDQHSQKLYWGDSDGSIKSADLNGKNIRKIYRSAYYIKYLTVSKDFIYSAYLVGGDVKYNIIQIPKNSPRSINMKPKLFIQFKVSMYSIAANYNIEDITQENQNCDSLKSLLPNKSVSTDNPVSLLYDHATKVSGASRCECTQGYSGERCDVSVCHNYCLNGDCSASADGQPKCSCNAGYSGQRCQVDVCQGYCLNDGICSLSQGSKPICRCTGHYEGERCEFPVFQINFLQAISLLKGVLNTDVTSDKGVKSSCASTAF